MSTNRDGKVAVVDAVRARLDDVDGGGRHRVPRAHRRRDGGAAARAARRGRRLQGLQEHPRAPGRRGQRPRPADELLEGPTAIAFVSRRRERGRQGPPGLRAGRRPALIVKGGVLDGALLDARELARARRPAEPRGAALDVRRRPRRADADDGRAPQGPAAEPRLRPRRRCSSQRGGVAGRPTPSRAGRRRPPRRRRGADAARCDADGAPARRGARGGRGRPRPRPRRRGRAPRRPSDRRGRDRRGRGDRAAEPIDRGRPTATDRRATPAPRAPPTTRSSKKGRPPPWLEH